MLSVLQESSPLCLQVLLLTLGGSEQLRRLRTVARAAAGLPDVPEDTVERTRTMRASSPPPAPADQLAEAVLGQQRPRFTRVGPDCDGRVYNIQGSSNGTVCFSGLRDCGTHSGGAVVPRCM